MTAARWVAIGGAGVVGVSLALQLGILVTNMMGEGATLVEAVWRYFAYFTILTNAFVFLVLARAALSPHDREGLNAPRVELMAAISILFVGVVYNLLLAGRWDPQGLQKIADVGVHNVAPVWFFVFWLLRAGSGLVWRDGWFAALWPSGYCAYGLGRGAVDGFYPYYFMDPTAMSWPQLALNATGLCAAFVVGALALVGVDRALRRRRG